jgi:hypothetical protein
MTLAFLNSIAEHQVHSRTPVLLVFLVKLPSTTATGRWRERGKMPPAYPVVSARHHM